MLRDITAIGLLFLATEAYAGGKIRIVSDPNSSSIHISNTSEKPKGQEYSGLAYAIPSLNSKGAAGQWTYTSPAPKPSQDSIDRYLSQTNNMTAARPSDADKGLVDLLNRQKPEGTSSIESQVLSGNIAPLTADATYIGKTRKVTYDPGCSSGKTFESSSVVAIAEDIVPTKLGKTQAIRDVITAMFREDLADCARFSIKWNGATYLMSQEKGRNVYQTDYTVTFSK